jgi:hypothetical protein
MTDYRQKIVAVDFDDTLFESRYPEVGPIKLGAKEAMEIFKKLGWKIVIYSCRTCSDMPEVFDVSQPVWNRRGVQAMIEALDTHGVPYDEIYDGSRGKILADLYIDDKGCRFMDNWAEIMGWIVGKELYN